MDTHQDDTIQTVGNLQPPATYAYFVTQHSVHKPLHVGIDPETNEPIFWGDGHRLTSDINDRPAEDDIPF